MNPVRSLSCGKREQKTAAAVLWCCSEFQVHLLIQRKSNLLWKNWRRPHSTLLSLTTTALWKVKVSTRLKGDDFMKNKFYFSLKLFSVKVVALIIYDFIISNRMRNSFTICNKKYIDSSSCVYSIFACMRATFSLKRKTTHTIKFTLMRWLRCKFSIQTWHWQSKWMNVRLFSFENWLHWW